MKKNAFNLEWYVGNFCLDFPHLKYFQQSNFFKQGKNIS